MIYDIEEDIENYYIIEQFLNGESLYALVSRLGYLSKAKIISYGIELCHIIDYLHSAEPNPILYLDLQPKNLLICQGTLKLVDFDQAVARSQVDYVKKKFGTVGCAAPEQYTDEPLDERTDIYAIGAVLFYLGTGRFPDRHSTVKRRDWGEGLSAVIGRCLCQDREKRFCSAAQVLAALEQLQQGVLGYTASSLIIALVGSKSGIGTTHASIGLSAYLAQKGYPNIYEEKNDTGAVNALGDYFRVSPDSSGLLVIRSCTCKPRYGENVRLPVVTAPVSVRDYGTDLTAARDDTDAVVTILICGGKWWELKPASEALELLKGRERGRLCVIFNHFSGRMRLRLPRGFSRMPCYRIPYFEDPFSPDSGAKDFYQALLDEELKGEFAVGLGEKLKRKLKRD